MFYDKPWRYDWFLMFYDKPGHIRVKHKDFMLLIN